MQIQQFVTEDQAAWLRTLETRHYDGSTELIEIPEDIVDALVRRGFARRWNDGNVTITLGGIREVARH